MNAVYLMYTHPVSLVAECYPDQRKICGRDRRDVCRPCIISCRLGWHEDRHVSTACRAVAGQVATGQVDFMNSAKPPCLKVYPIHTTPVVARPAGRIIGGYKSNIYISTGAGNDTVKVKSACRSTEAADVETGVNLYLVKLGIFIRSC
jgi:hypothetical protein